MDLIGIKESFILGRKKVLKVSLKFFYPDIFQLSSKQTSTLLLTKFRFFQKKSMQYIDHIKTTLDICHQSHSRKFNSNGQWDQDQRSKYSNQDFLTNTKDMKTQEGNLLDPRLLCDLVFHVLESLLRV